MGHIITRKLLRGGVPITFLMFSPKEDAPDASNFDIGSEESDEDTYEGSMYEKIAYDAEIDRLEENHNTKETSVKV